MEDLRKLANLQKSDVYRGVGVSARTYDRWIEGKTLPDVSKALALSKVLKAPLVSIFKAFGLSVDDIVILEDNELSSKDNFTERNSPNVSALVGVLKKLPDDQAEIVMHWLLANKKDGGPSPPSGIPT